MFWNKKPERRIHITEEERPCVGDLYEVCDDHKKQYLYFTEVGTPTLEGPGYSYVYFREDGTILNDNAMTESRHIDDSIIDGTLIKVENPLTIAKFALLV